MRGRDVAIGTLLAWVPGLGVLFLSLLTTQASGAGTGFSGVTVLFGNIVGISTAQAQTIALINGGVIQVLLLIACPLLFASLNPDVAATQGVPVHLLGLSFTVLLAVTVSFATMVVGALLVFALLLLPTAMAQRLTNRPFLALALASGLAVALTWLGITIGFYTSSLSSVCISLLAVLGYISVVEGRHTWFHQKSGAKPQRSNRR